MSLLPEASVNATHVDGIFFTLVAIGGAVMLVLTVLIVGFSFAYRRGSKTPRPPLRRIIAREVEIGWTVATAFAFLFIFWWATSSRLSGFAAPRGAMEIHVVAKQWMWKYQHPSGAREIDDLHVPAQTPVRLVMVSEDVIHSFFIPAFRMKQDVLPGRYTETWFQATAPGVYPIECAEYCGTDHAVMAGQVTVLSQGDYARWAAAQAPAGGLAARGRQAYVSFGCGACHDGGGPAKAPGLANLYGHEVQLTQGPPRTVDEAYLRSSILRPNDQIVAGYAQEMPAYDGKASEEDVAALVAYIKSLAGGAPA